MVSSTHNFIYQRLPNVKTNKINQERISSQVPDSGFKQDKFTTLGKPVQSKTKAIKFGSKDWAMPGVASLAAKIAVSYAFHPRWGRFSYLIPRKEWNHILGAPIAEEKKFKSADGTELRGYWVPAKDNSSGKTVILAHGFQSNPSSMLTVARELLQKNYNVFMFDFRGHGKSHGNTSIGYHEGKDLLGAVRHVKENYSSQSHDLTLMGHSMGASAILMLPDSLKDIENGLQDINKHVNRFVADAPYEKLDLSNNSFVTSVYKEGDDRKWAGTRKRLVEKFVERMNSQATGKLNFPKSFDDLRPAESFRQSDDLMKKPLLLLHGNKDSRTPYTQAQAISKMLPHATFMELEADHVDYDWHPDVNSNKKGKTPKRAVLRDKDTFLGALFSHLA